MRTNRNDDNELPLTQKEKEWEKEYKIPPRKTIHPSEREKLTTFFYRLLASLFFLLTFALLGWGLWSHRLFE